METEVHRDGLTPAQDAWLRSLRAQDVFGGAYSADEIDQMSMADFARLTGRQLVSEPTTPPQMPAGQDPAAVAEAQHPAHSAEHPGVDFSRLSMAEYAQLRGQLGMGQSGSARGIFDSADRQAQLDGARAHAGRSAWSSANVIEPPRIARQFPQGNPLDTRPAAQRFGL